MKSANEVLRDEFLALTANMQRLSESEVLIVVGILKQLEREISGELLDNPKLSQYTKRKYNALINQNKSTINAAYKRINEQNQALLYEVGALSQVGTQRAFSTIGFSLDSVALNSDQLKALASNTWIEGAPSSEWWKKQNSNLQYAFITQMRMGYAAGESIDQLVERVRGTSDGKKVPYIIDGETKYYTEFSGGILNTSRRQAETLVRTSVMSISAVASENMFESVADILKGIMWVATLDFRTSLLCIPETEEFSSLVPVEKVFRTKYEGDVIIIRTAAGKELVGTPKHPVLTTGGWLPLDEIQPGKHVLYSIPSELVGTLKEEGVSVESTFGKFFDTCREPAFVDGQSVAASSEDFYGDGKFAKGEISVKVSDGFLRNGSDAVLREKIMERLFGRVHDSVCLFGDTFSDQVLFRGNPTLSRSSLDSGLIQNFADEALSTAGGSNNIGKSHSVFVQAQNTSRVPLFSKTVCPSGDIFHNSGFYQESGDSCGGASVLFGDMCGGSSPNIELDNVVSVRREFRSCHVYTLQNCLGFYSVGGFIVKNCSSRDRKLYTLDHEPIGHNLPWLNGPGRAHWRCRSRAVPVTKSWEELGALPGIDKIWNKNMPQKLRSSLNGYVPQDLSFEDWLKGLPETDQIAYLGKKKYQIWKERGLTLEQLIDQRGNPLTLKQLANVYGYKVQTPLTLGMPSVPKSYPTALQTQQTAETLARDIVDSMEVAAKEEATKQVSKLTKNNPIANKLVQQAIVAGAVSNDDPVNMSAYLASALAAEEESRKRLAEERRRLNEGLHELKGTMSDQFIDYKERAAALKFAEDSDSILPSEKSAIYANKLAEIKQINSNLSNKLASLIEDDETLMSLFKKFSETASYREWDMRYTVDKFKKFVASSDAGRNSTRILRKIAKL